MKNLKKQTNLTKKSADSLMIKAKTQLDEALKKNDLQAAHIASGMMVAAESLRKKERTKEDEILKLNTEIERKKNEVLNKLLQKKS